MTKTTTAWRVIALLLTLHLSFSTASAQGWPADYKGVMLQGFYWDGYADSKWTVLESQANELSQYFDLIWIPQSGKTSEYHHTKRQTMGYDPCFWLDHNSCWGTQDELKKMIKTFKDKGTGIIEDVVINHKNGLNTWTDFPDETSGSYSLVWDNTGFSGICQDDECNSHGYKTTGEKDTGDNFDGYRDLDHTSETVQKNVKTYLDFLLNELGYAGFRYDMVKGYAAKYTGLYNTSANPTFSVGECWDSNKAVVTNWINGTKVDGKIQSAAFDFPMKYKINSAFGGGNWSALKDPMLSNDQNYARYSVTFVDNHDTFRRDEGKKDYLGTNICAANAYILTMPGTPCLFLKHWQSNKGTLKKLIATRKAAGITNQSEILSATASAAGFTLSVKGANGTLLLLLGTVEGASTDGYQLAVEGKKFKLYASTGVDLSKVTAITEGDESPEDDAPVTIPSFCTVNEGETCAFFVAPKSWGSQIKCWRWDKQYNYTGNLWPGVDCQKLGEDNKGYTVWKWTYKASDRKSQSSSNEGIIFNDGTNQTADLAFTNGGYYNQEGLQGVVSATAIRSIEAIPEGSVKVYSLDGRLIREALDGSEAIKSLKKGVYIINNKKVVIK